jgi:hypothetical protein
MFLISSLVIGPLINGTSQPPTPRVTAVDHDAHHS